MKDMCESHLMMTGDDDMVVAYRVGEEISRECWVVKLYEHLCTAQVGFVLTFQQCPLGYE